METQRYIVKRLHDGNETVINPCATLEQATQYLYCAWENYSLLYPDASMLASYDPSNAFVEVTYHDDITGFYALETLTLPLKEGGQPSHGYASALAIQVDYPQAERIERTDNGWIVYLSAMARA